MNHLIGRIFQQSNGGPETPPSELWAELCAMQWPGVEALVPLALQVALVSAVFVVLVRFVERRLRAYD